MIRHRAFRHFGVCDPALLASAFCFRPLTSLWTSFFACFRFLLLQQQEQQQEQQQQGQELSLGATTILAPFRGLLVALGGFRTLLLAFLGHLGPFQGLQNPLSDAPSKMSWKK